MSRTIPHLRIEQYALGELSPAQAAEVEAALGDALPGRLAALQADGDALLRRYPPRVLAGRLQDRRHPARLRQRAPIFALAGVLVAAVVLVAVRPDTAPSQPEAIPADGVIAKGLKATLVAHRQVGAGSERIDDGDLVRAGDRLQLATVVTEPVYGVVLSVDGRGVVTFHAGSGGAVPLEPGGPVQLSRSYVLDDAPRFERFFLVTSPEPFPLEPVAAAARALDGADAPLDLPPSLSQTSFTLVKP